MGMGSNEGVKQMRTPIRLLAAPKSMHSIIDATQREQRHGSAGNCLVSRSGVHLAPCKQSNPTPSLRSVFSGPQWPQQANSRVTGCTTIHVCSDAQACGRVAEIAGMVNIVGANVGSNSDKFISVLNLFYKY